MYAFTYMNIMEHWGSGIPIIIRRCKEEGLREPELLQVGGNFRINLYRFQDITIMHLKAKKVLTNAGTISAEIAKQHAESEFEKYRVKQDRLFESDFDKFMLGMDTSKGGDTV